MKNNNSTADLLLAFVLLAVIGASAAVPGFFLGAGLHWLGWIPKNGVPVVAVTWAILGIVVTVLRVVFLLRDGR